jgi:radical SAM protein with 4Fe4S-binding SPASM domain
MELLTRNKFRNQLARGIRFFNQLRNHPKQYTEYNKTRLLGAGEAACYAPLSSMYIASNGDVRACCMNTEQIYGNLKNQSLNEIWHSKSRERLCNASQQYKLPSGCQICIENFENGNAANSTAILYDQYRTKHKYPQRIDFELSLACNFDCRMCMFSSHQNQGKKIQSNFKFDEIFLNQLSHFLKHIKLAGFYGGEPFLIPIYYKIWDEIQAINSKAIITVQSNGSILNDKILNYLEKGKFQINFSIDSLQKDRFEFIRDKADFDQVMRNFKIINEISQKHNQVQSIAVCPMKQNLDEMGDLVEFSNKYNTLIYFNSVDTVGFRISELSTDSLSSSIKKLKNQQIANTTKLERINYIRYQALLNSLKNTLPQLKILEKKRETVISLSNIEFLNLLLSKLNNNTDKLVIEKLKSIEPKLPQKITLNQEQKESLVHFSATKIIHFIESHNEAELIASTNHFIEKGSFVQ